MPAIKEEIVYDASCQTVPENLWNCPTEAQSCNNIAKACGGSKKDITCQVPSMDATKKHTTTSKTKEISCNRACQISQCGAATRSYQDSLSQSSPQLCDNQ